MSGRDGQSKPSILSADERNAQMLEVWRDALRRGVRPVFGDPLDRAHERSLRKSIRIVNRHVHFRKHRRRYAVVVGLLIGQVLAWPLFLLTLPLMKMVF